MRTKGKLFCSEFSNIENKDEKRDNHLKNAHLYKYHKLYQSEQAHNT
jgi:hypothetical protein